MSETLISILKFIDNINFNNDTIDNKYKLIYIFTKIYNDLDNFDEIFSNSNTDYLYNNSQLIITKKYSEHLNFKIQINNYRIDIGNYDFPYEYLLNNKYSYGKFIKLIINEQNSINSIIEINKIDDYDKLINILNNFKYNDDIKIKKDNYQYLINFVNDNYNSLIKNDNYKNLINFKICYENFQKNEIYYNNINILLEILSEFNIYYSTLFHPFGFKKDDIMSFNLDDNLYYSDLRLVYFIHECDTHSDNYPNAEEVLSPLIINDETIDDVFSKTFYICYNNQYFLFYFYDNNKFCVNKFKTYVEDGFNYENYKTTLIYNHNYDIEKLYTIIYDIIFKDCLNNIPENLLIEYKQKFHLIINKLNN